MNYFNFDRLINKYACEFTVLNAGNDDFDDLGERTTSIAEKVMNGAIIGISESKIYRSDGVLTVKDKDLFMKESLGKINETHVIYDGNKYKVETNPQNNHQFTGVWQYTLKWVSAFEGGDTVV